MAPQVSAVAARKAAQSLKQPSTGTAPSATETRGDDTKARSIDSEASPRPRKRKRAQQEITVSDQKHGALLDGLTPVIHDGFDPSIQQGSLQTLDQDEDSNSQASDDTSESDISHGNVTAPPNCASAQQTCLISTFSPSSENLVAENETTLTVHIGNKDIIILVGQCDLWVRHGAVSIYGAVLHASSKLYRIYAPTIHALPVLRPIINPYGSNAQSTEVSLVSCGSRIQTLKNISSRFRHIWCPHGVSKASYSDNCRDPRRTFALLRDHVQKEAKRPLISLKPPVTWLKTVANVLDRDSEELAKAILVCGPKGSGKSTFARMIANGILTSTVTPQSYVMYLDLDPGQPEYGPPGQVSLIAVQCPNLGSPFTHPDLTDRSGGRVIRRHCLGSLSPKDDVEHFMACAADLIQVYRRISSRSSGPSLIVNCPGWVHGGGLDIVRQLVNMTTLTDVMYMSTAGPDESIDVLKTACIEKHILFHAIESQTSALVSRTAPELRMMQTLSYFHLTEPEAGNHRWDPRPLVERAPIILSYKGANHSLLGIMILGDAQCPRTIESLLEGSIVDIVEIEDDAVFSSAYTAMSGNLSPSSKEPLSNGHLDDGQIEGTNAANDATQAEHADQASTTWDLCHPGFSLTDTGIPYLRPINHITRPLSPSYSHSIGQALIRYVDVPNHAFHLLTPISPNILQNLHENHRKIVLVRGKLDTPTWAYKEGLESDKSRRRRVEKQGGAVEPLSMYEMGQWAARTPWASIGAGERKGSAKKRSGRKDLKYRSQVVESK